MKEVWMCHSAEGLLCCWLEAPGQPFSQPQHLPAGSGQGTSRQDLLQPKRLQGSVRWGWHTWASPRHQHLHFTKHERMYRHQWSSSSHRQQPGAWWKSYLCSRTITTIVVGTQMMMCFPSIKLTLLGKFNLSRNTSLMALWSFSLKTKM